MKGLIIKDLLNLKKTLNFICIFIVFLGVLLFVSNNMVTSANFMGMIILMSTMLVVTTISYDELAKWDNYALAMPITRKEIVLSKYLIMLILSTLGTLIGFILNIIFALIKKNADLLEISVSALLVLSFALIIGSIILPLLYKFGAEKARILIVIFCLFVTILAVGGVSVLENITITISLDKLIKFFLYASPIIAIAFVTCSYFISLKIYMKKDM